MTRKEMLDGLEYLWDLLDDVSTWSDAAKGDYQMFHDKVYAIAERRHDILTSDGYNLFTHNGEQITAYDDAR